MNSMLSRIGEPSISLICDPAAVKYDSQLIVVEIYTFLEKYWKLLYFRSSSTRSEAISPQTVAVFVLTFWIINVTLYPDS